MAIILPAILSGAVKAAIALIGSKFAVVPFLLASMAYFNYDLFDPENQPASVERVLAEYDFIVVGGGSAGSVLANRLTEIPEWRVLLLEAGGPENEITDVPIFSLYLHKSKVDWKYRTQPQDSACQAMVDKRCCWTRGKVLGGSSVLNTMLYIRGNRRDFDYWEAQGNPGWNYENVLYYFKKSMDQRNPYLARDKRYHATGGYQTVQDAPYNTPLGVAFLEAAQEMGYDVRDVNGEKQTGFAFYQYTMRRGARCSTAKAFLRPVRLRPNLHISMFSHVTKVLIDPNTKTAYGVEFIRDGKKQIVKARKEVILSAGAVSSPQLLMLSGVGPAGHLAQLSVPVVHDSPGVGRNIQDHIAVGGLAFLIDYPVSFILTRFLNLQSALRYAISEDGPLTSSVGLEAVGFINTKYANQSDDWPDIEFMLTSSSTNSDAGTQRAQCPPPQLLMLSGVGPAGHLAQLSVPVVHDSPGVGRNIQDQSDDWPDIEFMLTSSSTNSDAGTQVKTAHGLTDDFYNSVFRSIDSRDVFGVFPMMLRPKSRGHLKLASRNPLRHPLIYHNYLTHPDDVGVLREGVKAAIAFGQTDAMKRFGARFHDVPWPNCKHLPAYTDEYWDCAIRQYTMTIYHMSGSCKMGPNTDPEAVVDPKLRVYGIAGLRVIDASIMPTITNGNINAPVIMIGEKGADMIKEYWINGKVRRKRSVNNNGTCVDLGNSTRCL